MAYEVVEFVNVPRSTSTDWPKAPGQTPQQAPPSPSGPTTPEPGPGTEPMSQPDPADNGPAPAAPDSQPKSQPAKGGRKR